jgi:hypothetical protein
MISFAAVVDSCHVHSLSPFATSDQVQGVGYYEFKVETNDVDALELETDAAALELEMDADVRNIISINTYTTILILVFLILLFSVERVTIYVIPLICHNGEYRATSQLF